MNKVLTKIFVIAIISSGLCLSFYHYKSTIHSLEDRLTILEVENISLDTRLKQSKHSFEQMTSSISTVITKSLIALDDIKKGYSFIQTNAGVLAIYCKQEPTKSNSYIGKFLIGNPNNYVAREVEISVLFYKNSSIETKKYYITKDFYPGSWTEITVRTEEMSDRSKDEQNIPSFIQLSVNRVDFKGDIERMIKIIELMKITKSM